MSTGVSIFIIASTLASILGCAWLLWWTSRDWSVQTAQPPAPAGTPPTTGHVWDGDLEEYNNPLPRWWLWLFILTLVFAVAYLIYFPGLGSFRGIGGWTQVGEHQAEVQQIQVRLDRQFARVEGQDLHRLASDTEAMAMAKNLFAANCSTCHGSDARGARGFPNLTDQDWLWGASEAIVLATIADGRHGMMPALGGVLGDAGVTEVAAYVFSLNGRQAPADWTTAGKAHFATICSACHGELGTGNQLLGAPNLTDSIWLHGGDLDSIRTTIVSGRNNQMPAHQPLLGETRVRLLAAYVLHLSADPLARPAAPVATVVSE